MSIFDWRLPLAYPVGEEHLVYLEAPQFDDAGGFAPPPWTRVDLRIEQQTLGYWCWAACATSVASFFGPTGAWSQCQVAEARFQLLPGACCAAEPDKKCDQLSRLPPALEAVGHDGDQVDGRLTIEAIAAELAAGRPVAIRVEWPDKMGHFILITGVQGGADPQLEVEDPGRSLGEADLNPEKLLPLSLAALSEAYRGSGRWTHSYTTRSG